MSELKDKLKHKSEEYANTCRFYEKGEKNDYQV